jgi:DNA-binding response OmpR family regulator
VRVLVVSEDVKERLRAASALMLHENATVVEAESAEAARTLLLGDHEPFDVLVMDGDLAPRGGFAVLYDLRARAEMAGVAAVPSLIMADREQDRWLAGWAGANEMMLKPVDPFQLARTVAALDGATPAPYGDSNAAAQQVGMATRDHR